MTLKLAVLFLTPLLSGLLVFMVPRHKSSNYRLLLIFAGAYLFSITVIHILPELYRQSDSLSFLGVFVLLGFFLQQFLEYFTSGVEHGHLHSRVGGSNQGISALLLLIALCLHAFLEGGMLAQGGDLTEVYDHDAILFGIALHRAPAAFALMTVLVVQLPSRRRAIPYLLIFSIAAPAGLMLCTYLANASILSSAGLIYLYALVSGNFLQISTTIVFESSPGHTFDARKFAVALFGAAVAIAVEHAL
jgi:zinc transporter ZupT